MIKNDDKALDTPLIQQYKSIKEKHKDKILFFCCGDFFEMFFQDAIKVSEELGITLTSRKNGAEKVPMCGVPVGNKDFYIKKLMEKGYKVAICDQGETPAEAKRRGAKLVKRHITAVYTAGTYLDNTNVDSNYVLSVVQEGDTLYTFYVDISTEEFYYERINSNDFINLLQRVRPKEIIVQDNHCLNCEKWEEIVTEISAEEVVESKIDLPSSIKEFLKNSTNNEIIAIKILVIHLNNTFNKIPDKIPVIGVNSRETTLDRYTIQNLNLLTSFYQLLNHCCTSMGKRKLKHWILKPLLHKEDINHRGDLVDFFYKHIVLDSNFYHNCSNLLKSIGDVNRQLFLLMKGKRNYQSIEQFITSLKSGEDLINLFVQEDNIPELIREMVYSYKPMYGYKELMKVFVAEEQMFSEEFLKNIYGKHNLQHILYAITEHKQEVCKYIPNTKLNRNSIINYYFEITPKDRSLLNHLPNHIIKQTLLGSIRFTTETLIKLETDLLLLEEEQTRIREEVLQDLIKQIIDDKQKIQSLINFVEIVDVCRSLAEVAVNHRYTRPEFVETGEIIYDNGRNPIVEQYTMNFISNNLAIKENRLMFITGPNMGGKSTFMRTVAFIVLMGQMGGFVPAENAKLTIMKNIFVRIGFNDEEKEGESTFYKEMKECAHILQHCDQVKGANQLVIFDEICRGTSYEEGMALSQGIIEYLLERKVYVLISSHYLSLGKEVQNQNGIDVMYTSYLYENNSLQFLYKILKGVSDLSFGVKVGEIAGLPSSITKRAEELLQNQK